MNVKKQHRINAGIEQHFLDDAVRDKANMARQAHALQARGLNARAQFDLKESQNAASWIPRRQKMLAREKRLSK